jgi:hypothetical protein
MGRFNATAFSDVPRMNYESFMRVVEKVKPYRGTEAYPVGERRYSHRHFTVTDGKIEIWHANLSCAKQFRDGLGTKDWCADRHIVSIRPDNTVEFHNVNGIGDCMYLSQLLGGTLCSEVKHGGIVWHKNLGGDIKTHPVFKGLRVSLNDHSVHSDSQYKMIYRRVIPKEKKRVMGKLEEQLTIGFTMLDAMRGDDIKSIWKETLETAKTPEAREAFIREASVNNHCLDVVLGMTLGLRSTYWVVYTDHEVEMKRRIRKNVEKNKRMYLSAQPDAFKYIEREPFDFPSASWGITIKIGDKFVERL